MGLQKENITTDIGNHLIKKKLGSVEQNMKPMTLEKLNRDIDRSLEDSRNGKLISADDLLEKIKDIDTRKKPIVLIDKTLDALNG